MDNITTNFTQGNITCFTDNFYYVAVQSAGTADQMVTTITAAITIPLSIIAILFGYILFQFFVGVTTAAATGVAVIYALHNSDVSCDLQSWTAPAAAIVAFGLGIFIARRAGCLLGALIGGALPYLVFSLFPSISTIDTGTVPNVKFLGFYLLPVWASVGGSAILFGILLFRYINLIKIITTAGIGAYGVVAGTCLLLQDQENWVFAVAVSGSFLVSVVAQNAVKRYRARGSLGRDCDRASKDG